MCVYAACDVTLRDRIRRWWNPGKWRDEHSEVFDGEGSASDADQSLLARRAAEGQQFTKDFPSSDYTPFS
jgi:hypothetical protein